MAGRTFSPARARSRLDQDSYIAAWLKEAHDSILSARASVEIPSLLALQGYSSSRLTIGLGLYRTAESSFAAYQAAVEKQNHAEEAFVSAEACARQAFDDFRMIARFLFKDRKARAELKLDVQPPFELYEFIHHARKVYSVAATNLEYYGKLSQYGSVEAVSISLDELEAADCIFKAERDAVIEAVRQRDDALAILDDWLRHFHKVAHTALRGHPQLIRKVHA